MVEQVLHLVTEATAVQVKRLGQGKTSPILGKSRTSSQGIKIELGFPGGAVVKNLPDRAGDAGVTGSIPGLGRSPGEGNDNPLQVFLPGRSHGQRSLVVYIPWGLTNSARV